MQLALSRRLQICNFERSLARATKTVVRNTQKQTLRRSRRRRRQQLPEELLRRRRRGRLHWILCRNVLPRAVLEDLPDLWTLNFGRRAVGRGRAGLADGGRRRWWAACVPSDCRGWYNRRCLTRGRSRVGGRQRPAGRRGPEYLVAGVVVAGVAHLRCVRAASAASAARREREERRPLCAGSRVSVVHGVLELELLCREVDRLRGVWRDDNLIRADLTEILR